MPLASANWHCKSRLRLVTRTVTHPQPEGSAEDAEIVSAIVGLGRALGLELVAEGVETAEQLARFREIGCDLVQGFHLHRPVPGEELPALLGRPR